MNNNEEIMLYIAKMYKEIKQEVAEGRRKKPNNYRLGLARAPPMTSSSFWIRKPDTAGR